MSRFVPWSLVALCFVLGVASRSISDSFVVFVPALQGAFDASRSSITVVYSFALLVGGTGAPLAGWIVDRFGLRALTVIGMTAAALATASASQASEVWHLYLGLGVVMGYAGASLSGVLSASLLGRWFPAQRLGVALAIAWSAAGVGAIVILPLAQHLIATDGWRHAYIVFACISAAFIPLLLVLPWRRIEQGVPRHLPAARPVASSDGPTAGQAVREWPFWALSLSFGLTSVGIFSLAPQAMVYLLERGVDGAYAARALAVAGFLTPLGMVGFSWLADRGGRRLAALLAYGCSIAGVGALALVRGPDDLDARDLALSRRAVRPHLRPDQRRHGAGRVLRRVDRRRPARSLRRLRCGNVAVCRGVGAGGNFVRHGGSGARTDGALTPPV
jgi:MFS family permease